MKFLGRVILVFFAAAAVLPVAFTVFGAFMGAQEFNCYYGFLDSGEAVYLAFHMFPDQWSGENIVTILLSTPEYLMKFWNSIGITAAIAAGHLLVSCLAGFGFSKFRFPGRGLLFGLVVILMMMPYQVTLVSNYIMLDRLHLIGGYGAVILPGIFSSFGVFLMKQVMDEVPQELLEAARLDGAGNIKVLARIVLPMCRGGIAALLLLNFADNWNMVEQPVVFLEKREQYPLSVFLAEPIWQTQPEIFACGLLALLPPLLLFAYFRDELADGIAASGIRL